MCDFHSIIVRRDGAMAHVPENSHSGAAAACGWRENEPNKRPVFVEAEWDGEGEYPGADKITRVPAGEELTAAQRKRIDSHYSALASILKNRRPTFEQLLYWNKPAFSDVLSRLWVETIPEEITEWTGSLDVQQGATLTAPALTKVTGYLYVQQGATLTAPKLAH